MRGPPPRRVAFGGGVNAANAKGVQIQNCEIFNSDPLVGIMAEPKATDLKVTHVSVYDA